WIITLVIVLLNTSGDLLMAKAMKRSGDLSKVRKLHGIKGHVLAIVGNPIFYLALVSMAFAFYALMAALSLFNLSVVIPVTSSLTFLINIIGAKFLLKEKVDSKRWLAVALVAVGVGLVGMK